MTTGFSRALQPIASIGWHFSRLLVCIALGSLLAPGVMFAQAPAPSSSNVAFAVGPNYHATSADFQNGGFISRYQDPMVRATVLGQLQAMANSGASVVKTMLWQVGDHVKPWHLSFPLSIQELSNVARYVQDVAATRRPDGGYLDAQIGLVWIGCSDYTRGSPRTTVGYCHYPWSIFTAYAQQSISELAQRLGEITRPDGARAVSKLYLELEVMVGAKANQDRFLVDVYPGFLDTTRRAGLDGSMYFSIVPEEASILSNDYVDDLYPVLNGHRSLYWLYRSVAFLAGHGLEVPARLDFSFYPKKQATSYGALVNRVLDDFQAVFPGVSAAVVETYYFDTAAERQELGQAFAAAYLARGLPVQVSFWTTPYGGRPHGVGAPFDIAAFDLKAPSDSQSSLTASAANCVVQSGKITCTTTIAWSTSVLSATAAVWMSTGTGSATWIACGKSGQASVSSSDAETSYTFTLYATPTCDSSSTGATGLRVATTQVTAQTGSASGPGAADRPAGSLAETPRVGAECRIGRVHSNAAVFRTHVTSGLASFVRAKARPQSAAS
jgi:hypothetical protein